MSAVSLQRPLLHHLHLPSHLQLVVSPFCRPPTRCLTSTTGVRATLSRRSLFWGRSCSSDLGRSVSNFLGQKHAHLTWICRGEVGFQKAVRRELKKSPLIAVEEKDTEDIMEEKPSAKKRTSLVPKQLNLRAAGVHGSTFISYVQVRLRSELHP